MFEVDPDVATTRYEASDVFFDAPRRSLDIAIANRDLAVARLLGI